MARAMLLLGVAADQLSEASTDFQGTLLPFTQTSGGGGSAPAAVAGVPSGAYDFVTGPTGGGYSGGILSGTTAPSLATGGFYLRSIARLTTAATDMTEFLAIGCCIGSTVIYGVGFVGIGLDWGSASKFSVFGTTAGVYVNGTESSHSVDTAFHLFELWCPVGGGALSAAIDGDTISVANGGLSGSGSFGTLLKHGNAASLTMRVEFAQVIGVRP